MSGARGLEPAEMAAWRGFLEAHRYLTDLLEAELRDREDLPLTWYDVLVQLSEAPGRARRMQELAEAVLLSKSGLTRLVDRMEQAGLVERRASDDDGRGVLAGLTDAGFARLREASATHVAGVREHFSDLLDDEETVVLARALKRVAEAADAARTGDDDRS